MLSQVYKANRELFARLYPTTLVFKDGSTITVRYHEPRQILKIPLTLEDCHSQNEKLAWQLRRRLFKDERVDEETDRVKFDAKKYIRPRKR
jgi:large subunit ribosomal protein L55